MLETIKNYFEHIPSTHRALLLAGGITFFWLVEIAVPLFKFQYNKIKHAGLNLFFTFTTIVINFAFALLMVKASDWTVQQNFGLLHLVTLSPWLEAIAGLLLLDFIGAYLVQQGIDFAGIDLVGEYVTEVNVTSPTGATMSSR